MVEGPRRQAPIVLRAERKLVALRWGKLPYTIYPLAHVEGGGLGDIRDMAFTNRSYRYFTGRPLFRFGAGMSLTTFEHGNCSCSPRAHGSDSHVSAFDCGCTVRNTGVRDGDEVLQVYHAVGEAIRARIGSVHPVPLRKLVGFERLRLAASAKAYVSLSVPRQDLRITNATGLQTEYAGLHSLIFSRGSEDDEAVIHVTL